jgi:hypothetical protein
MGLLARQIQDSGEARFRLFQASSGRRIWKRRIPYCIRWEDSTLTGKDGDRHRVTASAEDQDLHHHKAIQINDVALLGQAMAHRCGIPKTILDPRRGV